MWQIRLEKDKFKWLIKHADKTLNWNKEQFDWLLKGIYVSKLNLHITHKLEVTVMQSVQKLQKANNLLKIQIQKA